MFKFPLPGVPLVPTPSNDEPYKVVINSHVDSCQESCFSAVELFLAGISFSPYGRMTGKDLSFVNTFPSIRKLQRECTHTASGF